jgi:hypothetical protein
VFPRESVAKSAAGIVTADSGERHQGGLAPTICCSLKSRIMKQDQLAVRGEADVELDPSTP